MNTADFFHVFHFETILPMIFGGLVMGTILFNSFKLSGSHVYLIALLQCVFVVIGSMTRFLEGGEWERFLATLALFYVFLGAAVLGQKLHSKIK